MCSLKSGEFELKCGLTNVCEHNIYVSSSRMTWAGQMETHIYFMDVSMRNKRMEPRPTVFNDRL